jgi:transcriptional regulator with XRE-family HTH domain
MGLEPKEVAHHLGVSSEAINRWERGGLQRPPARGQILLLAQLLDQTEQWFMEGETPPWSADDAETLRKLVTEVRDTLSRLDTTLARAPKTRAG